MWDRSPCTSLAEAWAEYIQSKNMRGWEQRDETAWLRAEEMGQLESE